MAGTPRFSGPALTNHRAEISSYLDVSIEMRKILQIAMFQSSLDFLREVQWFPPILGIGSWPDRYSAFGRMPAIELIRSELQGSLYLRIMVRQSRQSAWQ